MSRLLGLRGSANSPSSSILTGADTAAVASSRSMTFSDTSPEDALFVMVEKKEDTAMASPGRDLLLGPVKVLAARREPVLGVFCLGCVWGRHLTSIQQEEFGK